MGVKEFNWVKAVGYQHETLHTDVLRELLSDPETNSRLMK